MSSERAPRQRAGPTDRGAPFSLRTIAARAYGPTMLYGVGQGAVAPVIALTARDLGASVGLASLVVGLVGVGQILGDVPAGALTGRIGERRAMIAATVLVAAALAGCALATEVWMLGIAIVCTGLAAAVWALARQAYLTDVVPIHMRARALSTLGGTQRVGTFIGPFVGAGAMHLMGTDGAYWLHLLTAAGAGVLLAVLGDLPRSSRSAAPPAHPGAHPTSTLPIIRAHREVLRTLGAGTLLVGAVRASRQAVIPLWAEYLGLDPATTSIVFGVAGACDMLLFYPAGKVMDRVGRAWVAVPSMLLLGIAHLVLPLTHGVGSLTGVAVLMGIGNGLGSGIIMTLGSDVSPQVGRSAFLGVWRLCSDAGSGAGPLVISAVSVLASLGVAVLAMGVIGLAAAAAMGRWIPRYVPRQ